MRSITFRCEIMLDPSNVKRTTFSPNPVFKNFAISEEWPGGETQNRHPKRGRAAEGRPPPCRVLTFGESSPQAIPLKWQSF